MPSCSHCRKNLANSVSLRRHINSQHHRREWHACECGKSFLDPAGRSRCRRGHAISFGCPVLGCFYRSRRKDLAKQHVKRRHAEFVELEILTMLPLDLGSSISWIPNASPAGYPSPPQDLSLATPSIPQPQPYAIQASLFQSTPSSPETSPDS